MTFTREHIENHVHLKFVNFKMLSVKKKKIRKNKYNKSYKISMILRPVVK